MAAGRRAKPKVMSQTAPPPLTGCTVAVSGTFPGHPQAAIAERVCAMGGTFVKSVTQACTHLIATASELEKQTAKTKAALSNPNVSIVDLSWLDASVRDGVRAAEDRHAVAPAAASPNSGAAPPLPNPAHTSSTNGKQQQQPIGCLKRSASPDSSRVASAAPFKRPKKTQPDAAKAKPIPLDEGVPTPSYKVYVGPDGTIYDASLNQTNSSANNNKFYRIQVLHHPSTNHACTWTRWGRVGDYGQNAMLGDGTLADAVGQFEKKFKDKTGLSWADRADNPKPRKYAYLERSYGDSGDEDDGEDGNGEGDVATADANDNGRGPGQSVTSRTAESTLDPATQDLMKLIFNHDFFAEAMREMNYDSDKLPLGKLSKTTIRRGYQALKDLSEVLDNPALAASRHNMTLPAATEHLSNLYYTLIPHVFGRQRPPVISTNAMLKREIELLESLADMKDAEKILKTKADAADDDMHPLDRQFQGLGLEEMTPLAPASAEFSELKAYLCESVGATHGTRYEIKDIFRIERQGELQRFQNEFGDVVQDRRLLWHGSRCTNFAGILSQGLRIAPPEAPVSGYMFGKGIYLADMSSKSANYCAAYASNGHALLLLCEAELGKSLQELTDSDYNADERAKQSGMLSTWGKGRTGPQAWKDAGCVHPSLAGVRMPDMSVPAGPTNVPGASLLYNEYIVYDVAQVRLRYLLRVKL
ncbi:hypothetical protein VTK73DRAFT_304 [Phialemonium thermophilum]|uniref:Poly [ADP-ribose] polymerase n=1 Tax=Phialemonium thermophilum TaxID=223376 RepID=A0ABR3XER4_9PEZI